MAKSSKLKEFFRRHSDPSAPEIEKTSGSEQPFGKINFIMAGCCVVLIVAGFLLMSGPGSSIEEGFNPDIFSTRRIVVGPLLAFLGFLFMAFAIVWKPKSKQSAEKHDGMA